MSWPQTIFIYFVAGILLMLFCMAIFPKSAAAQTGGRHTGTAAWEQSLYYLNPPTSYKRYIGWDKLTAVTDTVRLDIATLSGWSDTPIVKWSVAATGDTAEVILTLENGTRVQADEGYVLLDEWKIAGSGERLKAITVRFYKVTGAVAGSPIIVDWDLMGW